MEQMTRAAAEEEREAALASISRCFTTLQLYNSTTLQLYNYCYNSTTLQLYNSTTLQLYN